MRIHISVKDLPKAFFELLAAITDHARLRFRDVQYDESNQIVILPIQRYPLLKKRLFRGNLHDYDNPVASEIIVRNVVSCEVRDNLEDKDYEEVVLLFGLGVKDKEVFVSSVEEENGRTCYLAQMEVGEIDIEIRDT
ncbi:MAG: hypothetical protein GTO14_22145 [Anaerolineales bacterium]|nr:hypothetical protein [Anaerolineales bacterium]